MDLICPKYHSGLDVTYAPRYGCAILDAQQRDRNWVYCCIPSPSTFSGQRFIKRRGGFVNIRLCTKTESPYSFASNQCDIKAWTKSAADNFYGDDDDTLFEPAHDEKPFIFNDSHGVVNDDNSAAWKLSWPLWLFGPILLLGTGVVPTLWLPSVPLFEGSATAGLLALAGLDGIFNLGASMFLLITDSCARSWRRFLKKGDCPRFEVPPPGYKVWTLFVNTVGLLGPLIAYVASMRGFLGAKPALLPMSAMIVPYMSLLLVHTSAEVLVWKWQSPVWAILPLVYDCYSVLQLSRGLQLGQALGAPVWTIEAVKGLISWWVFVLAVQFMWIAWFVGRLQS
eukprot:c16901_g1_i1 orf=270-1286(-)